MIGNFHDEYDGKGDASGAYTAANGEVQTVTGTVLPTLPASSPGARTTVASSGDSETATGTPVATALTSDTISGSTSASQTSAEAAQQTNGAVTQAGFYGALLPFVIAFVV